MWLQIEIGHIVHAVRWSELEHAVKKISLTQFYIELKVKRLFTPTSNVLPFKFKCLTAICCIVKLIPWNLISLIFSGIMINHSEKLSISWNKILLRLQIEIGHIVLSAEVSLSMPCVPPGYCTVIIGLFSAVAAAT